MLKRDYKILQIIPAQGFRGIFINVQEGGYWSQKVACWVWVEFETGLSYATPAFAPYPGHLALELLVDMHGLHHWKIIEEGEELDSTEIKEEVELCRAVERERAIEHFLSSARRFTSISKDLLDEIEEAISYPYKGLYHASDIAYSLREKGLPDWIDRPEDNEIVKALYKRWDKYQEADWDEEGEKVAFNGL